MGIKIKLNHEEETAIRNALGDDFFPNKMVNKKLKLTILVILIITICLTLFLLLVR